MRKMLAYILLFLAGSLFIFNLYIYKVLRYTCPSRDVQMGLACTTMHPVIGIKYIVFLLYPFVLIFLIFGIVGIRKNKNNPEQLSKSKKRLGVLFIVGLILVIVHFSSQTIANLYYKSIDCCGNIDSLIHF